MASRWIRSRVVAAGVILAAAAAVTAVSASASSLALVPVSVPACQDTAPAQATLDVRTANLTLPGRPFGLVYASEDIAFAALIRRVSVLNTSSPFAPRQIRLITLPDDIYNGSDGSGGIAITRGKRTIFVAIGTGAAVIDVGRAVANNNNNNNDGASPSPADPIVGFLNGMAPARAPSR